MLEIKRNYEKNEKGINMKEEEKNETFKKRRKNL